MTEIRPEEPADADAVFRVHAAAFGRPDEARLVDVLRTDVAPLVSRVAVVDGAVVGHVLVSPVTLEPAVPAVARTGDDPALPIVRACGLAPLAVLPAYQRRGIGAALVGAALVGSRGTGWQAVFVLGSPRYYGRFGFVLAAPRGFHYESAAFDPHFQVQELVAGALAGRAGWVRYAPAFGG